jgi:hypothetical protein
MEATMRQARTLTRLAAIILTSGVCSGLSLAQTGPAQTPTNVPKQTPPGPEVALPAGAIDLRPKFRTGQQIKYVFDQTAKSTVKSQDPNDTTLDQDQKQSQRLGLVMNVVQAGDEGATIQVVYESIKVSLTTPDGVAEYDSTKPATKPTGAKPTGGQPAAKQPPARPGVPTKPPATTPTPSSDPLKDIGDLDMSGMLGLIVGPMVGATVTVKTDRTGAITSVSGGDALGGSMGGLGGPGNKGYARVGETWANNDALSGTPVGAMSMKTTHTLKSASGGSASIAFVGGIEPASQGAAPGGGGAIGQVQSASYKGSYVWDTRAGALADMATDMHVVLDAAAAGTKARMTSDTQVKVHRQ